MKTENDHTPLKVDEAAALAGIGRNAFYTAVAAGTIPGVLRIGRSIRISRKAFLAWLDGGTEAA
ncbi:helix-turn-helix domain-containing protein [Sinomonas sp. P10A9]|uniref:Helix-turn-helix domain-containing protein n=1 Tax=Sinomonas puerhi TaxID=3238584 RepID=A0AB39L1V2_9MICC